MIDAETAIWLLTERVNYDVPDDEPRIEQVVFTLRRLGTALAATEREREKARLAMELEALDARQTRARCAEIEAERDALAADAARYRWLRAGVVGVSDGYDSDGERIFRARCPRLTHHIRLSTLHAEDGDVDKAIDAARAAGEK